MGPFPIRLGELRFEVVAAVGRDDADRSRITRELKDSLRIAPHGEVVHPPPPGPAPSDTCLTKHQGRQIDPFDVGPI